MRRDDDVAAASSVAAVFDRSADVYDTAIPFFARFGRRLVELAGVAPGDAVLDVACGRGASLFPAVDAVGPTGTVLGIDLAPSMVERVRADVAARGLGDRVDVRVGDALALDVDDDAFDVALSGFAVMLLPDPPRAVAELGRVVRAGGRVAVSMPTGGGPNWSFLGELAAQFGPRATGPVPPPPGPPPDLAALLAGAGLVDVEVVDETESFTFADTETWWRWMWSQGMRALLEALPEDALADYRAAAEERLRTFAGADGSIPLDQGVRYAIATSNGGRHGGQ